LWCGWIRLNWVVRRGRYLEARYGTVRWHSDPFWSYVHCTQAGINRRQHMRDTRRVKGHLIAPTSTRLLRDSGTRHTLISGQIHIRKKDPMDFKCSLVRNDCNDQAQVAKKIPPLGVTGRPTFQSQVCEPKIEKFRIRIETRGRTSNTKTNKYHE
jgi:hypothetical protein